MTNSFIIKFEGDEADAHRIPAYQGSKSIYGLTRSLVLVGHYLSEREVRKKYPFTDNIEFYLRASRKGSLEEIIQVTIQNQDAIVGGIVGAAASDSFKVLTDTTKYIFSRAVGLVTHKPSKFVKSLEQQGSGGIEALVDATENAMIQAHNVIGQGANNITIFASGQSIINLDLSTKEYVNTSILEDDEEIIDASVASLNANTGTGRIFIHESRKTIPFKISKEPDRGTFSALSFSLDRYVNKKPSDVQIRFQKIVASDGRMKRIIIQGAHKIKE